MTKQQDQQIVSFSINKETLQELKNYCKEIDRTKAYIVRKAVEQFLKNYKNTKNNQENKN